MIVQYKNHSPIIDKTAFIAPDAKVIGNVRIGKSSSILFCAIIRGDLEEIIIEDHTNIQDHTIIHTTYKNKPTVIKSYASIGHRCTLHSCTIGKNSLIGMGSIILDGAEIGDNCIVGAGSLITMGKKYPSGSLILGSPAKAIRKLSDKEINNSRTIAERYIDVTQEYKKIFTSET